MPDYKIYILDAHGKIYHRDDMSFRGDEIALAYAQALAHEGPVEVWEGTRRVGDVPQLPSRNPN